MGAAGCGQQTLHGETVAVFQAQKPLLRPWWGCAAMADELNDEWEMKEEKEEEVEENEEMDEMEEVVEEPYVPAPAVPAPPAAKPAAKVDTWNILEPIQIIFFPWRIVLSIFFSCKVISWRYSFT